MDDITDEELLALAASAAGSSVAAASTPVQPARHTPLTHAASSTAPPRPPATSFAAAFASVTNSSHYTSVANMPPPPAPAAATRMAGVTSSSSTVATPSAVVPPSSGSGLAPVPKPLSAHAILVSPRQRGNPVLNHISNVAYELGPKDMTADYVCGETCCALYLGLKYHLLHPNYLAARLQGVGNAFTLRVLLLLVDQDDSERPLLELTQLTFAYGWTLVCCWSVEEVARYLETLRAYEKKTAQAIAERVDDTDHAAKLHEALTEVRSINKTDVRHLAAAFGSFAAIAQASRDELAQTVGMGERKVRRLHHVMNQPFITSAMARRPDGVAGSATTTPAQAAAAHAAAMEKAQAAAAAKSAKKSAIVFFNQMPTTTAKPPATAVATAPAPAGPVSAEAAVAAGPTQQTAAGTSVAPPPAAASGSAAAAAALAPAAPPAPVSAPASAPAPQQQYDLSGFVS